MQGPQPHADPSGKQETSGAGRGLGGRPLLGGVGAATARTAPLLHPPLLCVLQARRLCFLPAGTQRGARSVHHEARSVHRGRWGDGAWVGFTSHQRVRQAINAEGGRRKITSTSALMAHEVILSDTGAGLPVFCKPVTTPRRKAWMTYYQSPAGVRKCSQVLEQDRVIGAN